MSADTGKSHAEGAAAFLADRPRSKWHDDTLWFVREKRDVAMREVPEWEELRNTASAIKDDVLANLDTYLAHFEQAATANGVNE